MEGINALLGFLFFVAIIGGTVWATSIAYNIGKNKKQNLKGKYLIIHHVYVGNINLIPDKDRILQLRESSSVCDREFGVDDEISDADFYLDYYKSKYSLKNKYDDLAEELFIPHNLGGGGREKRFEVIKFN